MPYTFNDDAIAIVDSNLNQLAVSQSQAITPVSQSGFIVLGVSGSTANFMKVTSDGTVHITGSVALESGLNIGTVSQGPSGSSPWLITGSVTINNPSTSTIGVVNQGASGSEYWKITGSVYIPQVVTITGSTTVNNFPVTQSIKIVDVGTNVTQSITGSVSVNGLTFVSGSNLSVFITGSNVLSISGTVHLDNAMLPVSISNFPTIQTITGSVTINNPVTTIDQGMSGSTFWLVTGSFFQINQPVTQSVKIDQSITLPVSISNFPDVQTISGTVSVNGLTFVSGSNLSVFITGSNVLPITGTVLSLPFGVQTISGTVHLDNAMLPVSISNFPTVQTITGTIEINNFPVTQSVKIDNWFGSNVSVGQKEMSSSIPFVIASNQTTVPVGGIERIGSYPDPIMRDSTVTSSLRIDAYKNLMIRGPIHTDEESFRDDFSDTSLTTSLTGTYTFTNGSVIVTGAGTLFTTELTNQKYIRLSAHADSVLAQIDYIIDDTNLRLETNYAGANGSGAAVKSSWLISIGSGASQTITSSLLKFSTGTTNGSINYISRTGDYLPVNLTFIMSASQRILNQETIIGFQDVVTNPQQQAVFLFDGTAPSIIKCRSSFSTNSIEETSFTLSTDGTISTTGSLIYEVGVTPSNVTFAINGSVVATHRTHLPEPYTKLDIVGYTKNTGTPSSNTVISLDGMFFQNVNQVQVGGIFPGEPLPVEFVDGGTINISYGGGVSNLPKMINVNFTAVEGAIIASQFKRVATYTIPAGFTGYLIKYVSYQSETAVSRIVAETNLGRYDNNTNTYTVSSSYTTPQWAATTQAHVTTAFPAGPGTINLTITYTNHLGVSGRTGTSTIVRPSAVGARSNIVLQTGDLGIISVQNVTTATAGVGIVDLLGLLQLATHQDQSTNTQFETLFAPAAVSFPTGTVLGIEYAGGTVSKNRNFDALIQLI